MTAGAIEHLNLLRYIHALARLLHVKRVAAALDRRIAEGERNLKRLEREMACAVALQWEGPADA